MLETYSKCANASVDVGIIRFRYDYMVLDEGHSIKNIKSSRFQRLRMVDTKHRLLLRFVHVSFLLFPPCFPLYFIFAPAPSFPLSCFFVAFCVPCFVRLL